MEVILNGRAFFLRQQCARLVQQVLEASGVDTDREIANDDTPTAIRSMFSNWNAQIKAVAQMFGYEDGVEGCDKDTYAEVIVHLQAHLTPAQAIKIFNAWWEVNEITDFFARGGKVLMPAAEAEAIEKIRRQVVQEHFQKILAEAAEAPEAAPAEERPLVVN